VDGGHECPRNDGDDCCIPHGMSLNPNCAARRTLS
jgi:hypothetical protein